MNIEAAFITYVLTQQTVTTLIGNRIRPARTNQAPVKEKTAAMVGDGDLPPRVTVDRIGGPNTVALTGATTYTAARLQVDVVAGSYASAKAVRNALRNCLHGYRGWMGDVFVGSCRLEDEHDFSDASAGLDSAATDGISMDFILEHQEDVPNGVPNLE